MEQAIATVIGVIAGSIFTLIGTFINNRFLLQQQRNQWKREDEKAQKEQDNEAKENFRKILEEIYSNCIRWLSTARRYYLEVNLGERRIGDEKIADAVGECHKWLSLVIIYYYNRNGSEFDDFRKTYIDGLSNAQSVPEVLESIVLLREHTIAFATNDPRLNRSV